MKSKIQLLSKITFFIVLFLCFQTTLFTQNLQDKTQLLNYSKTPYWIEMMNDSNVNYFEAVKAFDTFWKNRQQPSEENEILADVNAYQWKNSFLGKIFFAKDLKKEKEALDFYYDYKRFKHWMMINYPFVQPDGRILTPSERLAIWKSTDQADYSKISGNWQIDGPILFPTNVSGQIHGIGRVCQIKFNPNNSQKMYAASASGGLWISTNGGDYWTLAGTDNLPIASMASICIDYTNDNILYLGTGDPNYYGNSQGIWKSTNGGNKWFASHSSIGNRMAVEILMSPVNHNELIAATNDGIWKSTDAGVSWMQKKTGGNFTEMLFKPEANTNTIYAVTYSEFYRSTDMGESWSSVTIPGQGKTNGGRITVTKANPEVVYLSFVGVFSSGLATPVLKSTNSGQSFNIAKEANTINLNGYSYSENGQGNYNYSMIADPNDENTVYISAHVISKSTDGGVSWAKLTNWWATIHTDMHHFAFSPDDPSKLFNANDGGIWLTTNGGMGWVPKSDGLSATECYHAATSNLKKGMAYIGTQDNGELYLAETDWFTNRGGDWGSKMAFDYRDSLVVYYLENGKRRQFNYGEASWNPPFTASNNIVLKFSPSDVNVGFTAFNDVYRSVNLNESPSWTKITNINTSIKDIGISPLDANEIYVVTANGQILRSSDALSSTPSFTTLAAPVVSISAAHIEVVKSNPNVVYLSCNAKVYKSTNKGVSWTDISANLPGVNILNLIHDVKSTSEAVYVGMATGVYYTDYSMNGWLNYSKNLPTIAGITDLMIYNKPGVDGVLRVSYYGRGVWESPLFEMPTAKPLADFITDKTESCDGKVQFTDISANIPTNWYWDFGDGQTSTIENPSHTYTNNGIYSIKLKVSNIIGIDSIIKTNYITVSKINPPIANGASRCGAGIITLTATADPGNVINWYDAQSGGTLLGTGNSFSIFVNSSQAFYAAQSRTGCVGLIVQVNATVNPTPPKPFISFNGTDLVATHAAYTHQWYLNGTLIPGATAQTYTPIAGGAYTVENVTSSNCRTMSDPYMLYLGIDDDLSLNENQITIMPNPSQGIFTLSFESKERDNFMIEIFNKLGEKIYEKVLDNFHGTFSESIDLSKFGKDAYVITIKNSKHVFAKKIIVI